MTATQSQHQCRRQTRCGLLDELDAARGPVSQILLHTTQPFMTATIQQIGLTSQGTAGVRGSTSNRSKQVYESQSRFTLVL
eukprot:768511-Hanusia_phi.AAC.4